MNTQIARKRKPAQLRIQVDGLEERVLMATGTNLTLPQTQAYVTQLYYNILNRAPDGGGLAFWTQLASSGAQGRLQAVNGILNSVEARTNQVNSTFQRLLNRAPTTFERNTWVNALGQGSTTNTLQNSLLRSQEFFANQGSTNAGFVRALYGLETGVAPTLAQETQLVNQLAGGQLSRSSLINNVLTSPATISRNVQSAYNTYLFRAPETFGQNSWTTQIQAGLTPNQLAAGFLTSSEFVNGSANLNSNLLQTIANNPDFSILNQAIQTAGLTNTFRNSPYTLFAPTNEAFNALGTDQLDALLSNPTQLRNTLLYGAVPGTLSGQQINNSGLLQSAQGGYLGVTATSPNTMINTASFAGPSIRTLNGAIQPINSVLSLPNQDLFSTLQQSGNFSQFTTAVQNAGLQNLFQGTSPYTIFAPTDQAINNNLTEWQNLLNSPPELASFIQGSVSPGQFSTTQIASQGVIPTLGGTNLRSSLDNGAVLVNDATINSGNLVATNGIIQPLETVLFPPSVI